MEKTIVRRLEQLPPDRCLGDMHPVLQRVYAARGIVHAQDLSRGLEGLLPYEQLQGIDTAVKRLHQALVHQERVLIVGDFDADGATSTAVAVTALRQFGLTQVHYMVPNRFEYGYGLTPEIVQQAAQWQPQIIMTVDNGISSCAGVAAAAEHGIDVVITDHHLPGDVLPAATAIVNPNQEGDAFPSKNLAGVGVIFYVMLALRSFLREQNWFAEQKISEPNMAQFLDLVALGTVADVVALYKNNRLLVHQGLARIKAGKARPGIQALLEVGKRTAAGMTASDLSFAVAPRLNAAGRLDDMSVGIECLLTTDPTKAKLLAGQLDALNEERREIEARMQDQALKALDKVVPNAAQRRELPRGLCLFDEEWHQGVIGIVAGRLKERFHRPVIAFARANETEFKGSARSVTGLHIRDALDNIARLHPEIMSKFGGHAMAAGLTIKQEHYQQFSVIFDQEVRKYLSEADLESFIHSDGPLSAGELILPLAQAIREGGPWGQAFPEPLFDGQFTLLEQRLVGGKHLKMSLAVKGHPQVLDGIAFNVDLNRWPNHRCEAVEAAYRLDINEFRGQRNLQLIIEHLIPL